MSLHGTAPELMVSLKGEDFVVEEVFESGAELNSPLRRKRQVLKKALKSACLG